jgi:hypothetical protein
MQKRRITLQQKREIDAVRPTYPIYQFDSYGKKLPEIPIKIIGIPESLRKKEYRQSLTNFHRSVGKFYSKNFKLHYNSETCKCIGKGRIIVPTEAYFEHKPNPDLTPIENEQFEIVETYVRVKAVSTVATISEVKIEIETDEKFSASELELLSKNLI